MKVRRKLKSVPNSIIEYAEYSKLAIPHGNYGPTNSFSDSQNCHTVKT